MDGLPTSVKEILAARPWKPIYRTTPSKSISRFHHSVHIMHFAIVIHEWFMRQQRRRSSLEHCRNIDETSIEPTSLQRALVIVAMNDHEVLILGFKKCQAPARQAGHV